MKDRNTRTTVVCLHGSAGTSGMWREFIAAVRGRCDVITPDIDACDLHSVLAQIDGSFHLVGHGYGGELALEFAAHYPDRVLSLVLYEPTSAARSPDLAISAPVRLISGTRSWVAARRSVERMAERLPNATLLKLVGLRHMAPLTQPQFISSVILDYILPVTMPEQARAA